MDQYSYSFKDKVLLFISIILSSLLGYGRTTDSIPAREHFLLNNNWRFALGNPCDTKEDFNFNTNVFSYLAKTGYGDGPAAEKFDDRGWRVLNIPHDWCVELPFDNRGSGSHGFKAIGRNFPENNIGWYRKSFSIPASDLGKRISMEFDGVYRNASVFVNGFYAGTEPSGYNGFSFDISEYLNYGGNNVVSVRVDAGMEEGWFYEGAGIYRNVWLTKTTPVHVARYGTFVTTDVQQNTADITARTTVKNESDAKATFDIEESIVDGNGKEVAKGTLTKLVLAARTTNEYRSKHTVAKPVLWSIENPFLHKLKTTIKQDGKVIDTYETSFGIRTVKFDPNLGFFLNGKSVKLKGTNLHQDHAGVGVAMPDGLQDFRILKMKEMGSNAIRTSHNPPTPEFLDACDRLGMLVLVETRLMGINDYHKGQLETMMKRDRNHPSVFVWSLGNEEWQIEGDIKGSRIVKQMQAFARSLDSSRAFTVAISGGWDTGIGMDVEVMGFNYLSHGDIDAHHKKFPWQSSIGTEESNTVGTRGVYKTNDKECHLAPKNLYDGGMEGGWKYFAERQYLSGLFYWTGFDYRGEPTPYGWPAINSQFGIVDMCGFPKDNFFYLKSWWGTDPVVHIAQHWNKDESKSDSTEVVIYSNCPELDLQVNGKSQGKKTMPVNSHLSWKVKYEPGVIKAIGYKAGKEIASDEQKTTGKEAAIQLISNVKTIKANGTDISIITVKVTDANGLVVPTASNEIAFSIEGEGVILGVGNGDPSSHEADQYHDKIRLQQIYLPLEKIVPSLENRPETALGFNDTDWEKAYSSENADWKIYENPNLVFRGSFDVPSIVAGMKVNMFTKSVVEDQSIYLNGKLLRANIKRDATDQAFVIDPATLKTGKNEYSVVGRRIKKMQPWDYPNTDPGVVQLIYPAEQYKRKVFNGLAQIIIQSTEKTGTIKLKATSAGLKDGEVQLTITN